MTQSNFSAPPLASKPAPQRNAIPYTADIGDGRLTGPAARLLASHDAARELAYGCVDWFIYVTDAVGIGPMARMTGSE